MLAFPLLVSTSLKNWTRTILIMSKPLFNGAAICTFTAFSQAPFWFSFKQINMRGDVNGVDFIAEKLKGFFRITISK